MTIGDKVKHIVTGQLMTIIGNREYEWTVKSYVYPCKNKKYIASYEEHLLKPIKGGN